MLERRKARSVVRASDDCGSRSRSLDAGSNQVGDGQRNRGQQRSSGRRSRQRQSSDRILENQNLAVSR